MKKEHKYTKYRPKGCQHPPFEGLDYCWRLSLAVDSGASVNANCELCEMLEKNKDNLHEQQTEKKSLCLKCKKRRYHEAESLRKHPGAFQEYWYCTKDHWYSMHKEASYDSEKTECKDYRRI